MVFESKFKRNLVTGTLVAYIPHLREAARGDYPTAGVRLGSYW